jgi:hypothetical protein
MIAKVSHQDLPVIKKFIEDLCTETLTYQDKSDAMILVKKLKRIVPEFKSQNSVYEMLDIDTGTVEIV